MAFCGISRLFRRRRSKSKKNKDAEKPCAPPPTYSADSPPPSYNENQCEPKSVQHAQPETLRKESDHVFFMLNGNSVKRLTPREYETILTAVRAHRTVGGGVDIDPNNRLLFFRYGDKELSNKVKTTFSCSNGARVPSDYVKSAVNLSSRKGKKELHPLVTETEVQRAKRKELMRKIQEEEEFFVPVPWTEYIGDVAEIRRLEEEGCEPKKKFPSWNTVWAVVPEKDLDDPRYTKNTAPSVVDVPIY